jgi:hypothetical protein
MACAESSDAGGRQKNSPFDFEELGVFAAADLHALVLREAAILISVEDQIRVAVSQSSEVVPENWTGS